MKLFWPSVPDPANSTLGKWAPAALQEVTMSMSTPQLGQLLPFQPIDCHFCAFFTTSYMLLQVEVQVVNCVKPTLMHTGMLHACDASPNQPIDETLQ